MNGTTHLPNKVGWVLCALLGGVLVWMLTGCTSYQDPPRYRDAYYEPSPQPETSYAEIRTESDFYQPLSSYGRWEVVGSYGRCWIPNRVEADWRPYSNGYWRRTDDGWYWETDEPWGWATYHYGRWDSSPQFGWYWVPQTQWAPSWVYWRQGGGYVGWAPLRPSARFGRNGVMVVQQSDISSRGYVFVEERRFLEPVRPKTVIVNNTIINKTVNITKIKVVNKTVINECPSTTVIEQISGRKVQTIPVRELRRTEEAQVVTRQRIAPSTNEKNVPAPVQSQAEKALPASEPRQVAKPVITTAEPQPPVTKKEVHQADDQTRAAKLDAEQRVRQEKARAMESEKDQPVSSSSNVKPAAERQAVIQGQKEQKAVEKRAEQPVKQAKESDKKVQQVSEQRAKEEQAASEKDRKNAAKEDQNKKGKEHETSPENPGVSPQSPH